jgi:CheY-like chemotaxis protein
MGPVNRSTMNFPTTKRDETMPSEVEPWQDVQDVVAASVMLIDDSAAVRKIVEVSFRRVGVEVSAFPDGLAAIAALQKNEVAVPHLLLLDISLPKMDGYEVARILRTNPAFQDTIIVMLTGHAGVIDRLRSKMVGARDYIRKPFRVSEMVNTVCSYLGIPAPGSPGPASGGAPAASQPGESRGR